MGLCPSGVAAPGSVLQQFGPEAGLWAVLDDSTLQ